MASGGKRRGTEQVGDMVRSLAVVLALVAVVVALNLRDDPDPVKTVDVAPAVRQARAAAPYAVLAPEGLGGGWRATSVRTSRADGAVEWHIGYVTPAGAYAGVDQSDGSRERFVDRFAAGGRAAGTAQLDGRTWQRLEGGDPEVRALVSSAAGATTVVSGGASWRELDELAASLRD